MVGFIGFVHRIQIGHVDLNHQPVEFSHKTIPSYPNHMYIFSSLWQSNMAMENHILKFGKSIGDVQ